MKLLIKIILSLALSIITYIVMMNQRGLIAMDVFRSMEYGLILTIILILILSLFIYFTLIHYLILSVEDMLNNREVELNDTSLKEELLKVYPDLSKKDIN